MKIGALRTNGAPEMFIYGMMALMLLGVSASLDPDLENPILTEHATCL